MKWRHAGLNCEIKIHPTLGHWCGYVEIPPGHPVFETDYWDIPVDVHGGLTYSDINLQFRRVGFDCAHAGDCVPALKCSSGDHYWTWEEVRDETNRLAEQLARLKS